MSTAIDDRSDDADLGMLLEDAELFRLDDDEASEIVREVSSATSRWRQAAESVGLSGDAIERMEPAFEHDSAKLARETSSRAT